MSDEFNDDLDTPTEQDLDLAYGSKFLSASDIGERKVRTKILKVRKEELRNDQGKKKIKFVIFFDALEKPLIVNATNKDALVDKLGRAPANWIGASIGLFVDHNVMYAGKRVDGLRLRVLEPLATKAPSPKPAASPGPASEWPEEKGDPGAEFNDGIPGF